jgi:hypothetical protein
MYREDMQTQAWRLLTPERSTFKQELRGENGWVLARKSHVLSQVEHGL